MVEILCTAFSYKELYKNYQKVVDTIAKAVHSISTMHRRYYLIIQ